MCVARWRPTSSFSCVVHTLVLPGTPTFCPRGDPDSSSFPSSAKSTSRPEGAGFGWDPDSCLTLPPLVVPIPAGEPGVAVFPPCCPTHSSPTSHPVLSGVDWNAHRYWNLSLSGLKVRSGTRAIDLSCDLRVGVQGETISARSSLIVTGTVSRPDTLASSCHVTRPRSRRGWEGGHVGETCNGTRPVCPFLLPLRPPINGCTGSFPRKICLARIRPRMSFYVLSSTVSPNLSRTSRPVDTDVPTPPHVSDRMWVNHLFGRSYWGPRGGLPDPVTPWSRPPSSTVSVSRYFRPC